MKWFLASAFLAISASQAGAQMAPPALIPVLCGSHAAIVDGLKGGGEVVVAMGVDAANRLVEVFGGQSGSWTLVLTKAGGQSCIYTVGDGWQQIGPKAPESNS